MHGIPSSISPEEKQLKFYLRPPRPALQVQVVSNPAALLSQLPAQVPGAPLQPGAEIAAGPHIPTAGTAQNSPSFAALETKNPYILIKNTRLMQMKDHMEMLTLETQKLREHNHI